MLHKVTCLIISKCLPAFSVSKHEYIHSIIINFIFQAQHHHVSSCILAHCKFVLCFFHVQCVGMSSESANPDSSGCSAQPTATSSSAGISSSVEQMEPPLKKFKFLQQQLSISNLQSHTSSAVGPETELANYAAELCSTTMTNITAIAFWQARETGYPLLSKVALDLISAPASQAYTERMFSVCGDLTAGKRNRMTRSLERRVFLRANFKYL